MLGSALLCCWPFGFAQEGGQQVGTSCIASGSGRPATECNTLRYTRSSCMSLPKCPQICKCMHEEPRIFHQAQSGSDLSLRETLPSSVGSMCIWCGAASCRFWQFSWQHIGERGLTNTLSNWRYRNSLPSSKHVHSAFPCCIPVDMSLCKRLKISSARELKSPLEHVLRRIVAELFEKGLSSLTFYRFAKLSLPANVPNLDRDSMVKPLEVHSMVKEISKQSRKGKRCIVPNVSGA